LIREVENPSILEVLGIKTRTHKATDENVFSWDKLNLVGSGKAALSLILGYLRQRGDFPNKTFELIVPAWIGFWVYNQINGHVFPSRYVSSLSRGILVYHQYGFPQDMDRIMDFAKDKKLVIIEDCAHAVAGRYKGRALGSFGDFTLYSFSKFFFCFTLGAVRTADPEFEKYFVVQKKVAARGISGLINMVKVLSEYSSSYPNAGLRRAVNNFLSMTYALYGQSPNCSRLAEHLMREKVDGEMTIRKRYYDYFREQMDHLGICDHLEREGVYPYIIPIKTKELQMNNVVSALRKIGFNTGIYQFDVNRFLIEPKFEPCVWVLCHGGINEATFDRQVQAIKKTL
jgi:dTDP-4-amino-4,6-dideoxygalactose transaminase